MYVATFSSLLSYSYNNTLDHHLWCYLLILLKSLVDVVQKILYIRILKLYLICCINLSSECSPLEKSLKGNGTLILDLYNFRYVPLDKG